MAIAKNSAVSLHYEMFDTDNQLLDKTEEPIVYLHGGYDGIFPLVEEALHGKEVGDTVDVVLSPDDPATGDVIIYRVTDVADGKAVVDGNHPLAGMKIRFKATVDSIRDATDEEIAHGHIHGPHGHHH